MARKPVIFVLNGPNLNMLGLRQPDIYGYRTLADIEAETVAYGRKAGFAIDFRQTNHEGELIAWCHEARDGAAGIVINAAALARTSLSLHDAILAAETPTIEIHLSNIYKRESYRPPSYLSKIADAIICGLGPRVYTMGIDAVAEILGSEKSTGKRDAAPARPAPRKRGTKPPVR